MDPATFLQDKLDALRFCQRHDIDELEGYVDEGESHVCTNVEVFSRVTEGRPNDPHAGIASVRSRIWEPCPMYRSFFITLLRCVINIYAVSSLLYSSIQERAVFGNKGDKRRIEMTWDYLRVCDAVTVKEAASLNMTAIPALVSGMHCLDFHEVRFTTFRILTWIEFAIIFSAAFTVGMLYLRYLVLGAKSLPCRYPFYYIFALGITGRFSFLVFLPLLGPSRIKSIFVRHEAMFWRFMLSSPSCVQKMKLRQQNKLSWSQTILLAIVYTLLVAASFESLLLKLTAVTFANIRDSWHWTPAEWMAFIGFVNQLAGMSMADEVELHRMVLFVFGGADAVWKPDEIVICKRYFSTVASKITNGRIEKEHGRFGALVAMTSLRKCSNLQKLFLTPAQEERITLGRPLRARTFKRAYASEEAREFRRCLEELLQNGGALFAESLTASNKSDDEESQLPLKDTRFTAIRENFRKTIEIRIGQLCEIRNDVLRSEKEAKTGNEVPLSFRYQLASEVQLQIEQFQDTLKDTEICFTHCLEQRTAELDDEDDAQSISSSE